MKTDRINLLDSFNEDNIHSSILLSYSFDIKFYENVILRELKHAGSRNNIVVVDWEQYQNAVKQVSADIVQAGKYYSICPVFTSSVFHPKIIMLFGEDTISIIIGSGNIGVGGYSLNQEIFIKISFNTDDDRYYPFARSVWEYVKNHINVNDHSFPVRQITSLENEYPWLTVVDSEEAIIDIDKQRIQFLYHSEESSIYSQFISHCKKEKIIELYIISPYYDKESNAIKAILRDLNPKKTFILLDIETVNLNYNTFPKSPSVNLYSISPINRASFLHAKLYLVITNSSSHILVGSPNCTTRGLGGRLNKTILRNEEAAIYSNVLDKNYFKDKLGLDALIKESKIVDSKALSKVKFQEEYSGVKSTHLKINSIEYSSGRFIVQTESNKSTDQVKLYLLGQKRKIQLPCMKDKNNLLIAKFTDRGLPEYYGGYLKNNKGVTSNSVFIHYHEELTRNAPPPKAAQVYHYVQKLKLENRDLAGMLEGPFEKLLFGHRYTKQEYHYGAGKSHSGVQTDDERTTKKVEYIDYSEFMEKTKTEGRKIGSIDQYISYNTEIGALIEFLLSTIGIQHKKDDKSSEEIEVSEQDEPIYYSYEEEESDSELEQKEDTSGKIQDKENEETVSEDDILYLRRRILYLGMKYIKYLDFLIHGNTDDPETAPNYLDQVEIFKYLAIAILLNSFAGRKIKTDEGEIEVLELDGTNMKSYWEIMFNIISRMFGYQDEKYTHYSVIQKIRFPKQQYYLSEDLVASLTINAYSICFLWELFKNGEDNIDTELLAYKSYLTTMVYSDEIDDKLLIDHFKKYYESSGYYNKSVYLYDDYSLIIPSIDSIIERHSEINRKVKRITNCLKNAEKKYQELIGRHPRVRKHEWVWVPRIGLSYVQETYDNSVVLTQLGSDNEIKYAQGYVMKLEM